MLQRCKEAPREFKKTCLDSGSSCYAGLTDLRSTYTIEALACTSLD